MADINTYMGNAALGQGGSAGADIGPIGPIDLKEVNDAVDKTTYYQVLEKRDKWAQNNLVIDKMAKDAAAGLDFKLGDLSEINRDRITGMIKDLNSYFTEHPTAFTLDPLSSNSKEVAQMQQMTTAINQAISAGNAQRVRETALLNQINGETSEYKRGQMIKWYEKEKVKPLNDPILLYPDLQPYAFVTPDTYTVDGIPYEVGGTLSQDNWVFSDIQKGKQQVAIDVHTNPDAQKSVTSLTGQANQVLAKYKKDFPDLTYQELHDKMAGTSDAGWLVNMADNYNKQADLQNKVNAQRGIRTTLQALNIFEKGEVTDDDTIGMQVAGRSSFKQTSKVLDEKLWKEKADLALEKDKLSKEWFVAKTGRGNLTLEERKYGDQKRKEGFSLDEKVRAYTGMQMLQFEQTTDKNGLVDVPLDQERRNIFGSIPQFSELEAGDKDEGLKAKGSNIKRVQVKGDGQDVNNATYRVTFTNPTTGKDETADVKSTQLWNLTDNMYGEKYTKDMQDVSRAYEQQYQQETKKSGYIPMQYMTPSVDYGKLLGNVKSRTTTTTPDGRTVTTTPGQPKQTLKGKMLSDVQEATKKGEQIPIGRSLTGQPLFYNPSTGEPGRPLPLPKKADGSPDTAQMIEGKSYLLDDGSVIHYNPKKKKK